MLTHGSRQPASWLIFDVRQAMKTPKLWSCSAISTSSLALVCYFTRLGFAVAGYSVLWLSLSLAVAGFFIGVVALIKEERPRWIAFVSIGMTFVIPACLFAATK